MHKRIVLLVAAWLLVFSFQEALAQKKGSTTEVLYFKANLTCCAARSCNAAEAIVKSVVENNFPDGKVVFKEVRLADPENKDLVERFNAKSQTLIIISNNKKKENITDASDLLRKYNTTRNKEVLEQELVAKIKETML